MTLPGPWGREDCRPSASSSRKRCRIFETGSSGNHSCLDDHMADVNAVMVSTHLDDAVFSATDVLNTSTLVVTVFAGIPDGRFVGSWDDTCGASDSRKVMRDRRQEDEAALSRYGCRFVHMDFLGGQYVTGHRKRESLIERIAMALQSHCRGPVDVYAPAGIGHPEHADVRDAALRVRPDATLYADLPYAARARARPVALPRAVAWTGRSKRDAALSRSAFRLKLRAVKCYASQIRTIELAFPGLLTEQMLGKEVYWS